MGTGRQTCPQVLRLLRDLVAMADGNALPAATAPRADRGATTPLPAENAELVAEIALNGYQYSLYREKLTDENACRLSPREQEIVRLVAKGFPNKMIADVLDISQWTVGTYLRRIFVKLQVNSRAEMVARALRSGTLSVPRNH